MTHGRVVWSFQLCLAEGVGRTGGRLRAESQGRGIDSRSGGLSHPSLSIGGEQLGIVPPQLFCDCFYFCVFGLVVGDGASSEKRVENLG